MVRMGKEQDIRNLNRRKADIERFLREAKDEDSKRNYQEMLDKVNFDIREANYN